MMRADCWFGRCCGRIGTSGLGRRGPRPGHAPGTIQLRLLTPSRVLLSSIPPHARSVVFSAKCPMLIGFAIRAVPVLCPCCPCCARAVPMLIGCGSGLAIRWHCQFPPPGPHQEHAVLDRVRDTTHPSTRPIHPHDSSTHAMVARPSSLKVSRPGLCLSQLEGALAHTCLRYISITHVSLPSRSQVQQAAALHERRRGASVAPVKRSKAPEPRARQGG